MKSIWAIRDIWRVEIGIWEGKRLFHLASISDVHNNFMLG
jgi:hypothetical protein